MKSDLGRRVAHRNDGGDSWPAPLEPAALHGLAGDVVRAIEPHSEADPTAILVQLFVAYGNVVGRGAFFCAEADRHHANLFATLVGVTSKGRKGASWGQVRRVMHLVDPEWCQKHVASGLASGEGLIWAVRDPTVQRQPRREGNRKAGAILGYEDVVVDAGVTDKRLMVMESEFASVLQVCLRDKNTLSAVIRQAWDMGDVRTVNKNSPAVATGAHISIVGHITRDELRRLISATDLANGLANRFLWICVRRSKTLPEGGNLRDEDLEPLAKSLRESVAYARAGQEISRDSEARKLWSEVYPVLSSGRPGLLGAATSRAESQVMRLAMLYALLDRSPVIRVSHLQAGLAIWRYAEQSARYIFGNFVGDPVADEILRALHQASPKGRSRSDIRDLLGRHQKSDRIASSLELLRDTGLARCESVDTGGRPAEFWYACT